MDRSTDKAPDQSLWDRLCSLFSNRTDDSLEQAVLEARNDGELDREEGSMILSILRMDDVQVQDIMTPRTDFDCMPSGTPVSEVAKTIMDTGHSRLPIYKDTRDNIIGIAYAKDLLPLLVDPKKHSEPVDQIIRPPFFVPETKVVSELLQEFRARKNHIAIAVDEYGGTSGLATIEDVLEQIVGDIEDEHDAPREKEIRALEDGRYEVAGRTYLEDLAELGVSLEAEEVDTIGGYLCLEAGHVPQAGETFLCQGWKFTVKEADVKQIRWVMMERQLPKAVAEEQE